MNDKFFPELARRLKREGISTGPVENACLPVLVDGRAAVMVMPRGTVAFNADVEHGPEADSVYDLTSALSQEVYEYTEAMASAPPLVAEGLHEGFRVLADFNGVVLAGQELEADWGYKFVTWRRSPDRTAVGSGEYFDGGHFYGAAKLDFACRAGLVDKHRQFTDEQLTELYRCVCETLEDGYPLTKERREVLEQAAEQIEGSMGPPQSRLSGFVGRGGARERTQFSPQAETELSGLCPDEDERVSLSNQRELEAEGQADNGPEMGLSP